MVLVGVEPPFSPVRDPRLEWKVGLFSLEPAAAPCGRGPGTRQHSATAGSMLDAVLLWW